MTKPDCCMCGYCCMPHNKQDVFCDLLAEDLPRIPKKFRRYVRVEGAFDQIINISKGLRHAAAFATAEYTARRGPLKDLTITKCALLRGVPGQRVWCAVYKNRPYVCRTAVNPGDATCRFFRMEIARVLKEEEEKEKEKA